MEVLVWEWAQPCLVSVYYMALHTFHSLPVLWMNCHWRHLMAFYWMHAFLDWISKDFWVSVLQWQWMIFHCILKCYAHHGIVTTTYTVTFWASPHATWLASFPGLFYLARVSLGTRLPLDSVLPGLTRFQPTFLCAVPECMRSMLGTRVGLAWYTNRV